MTFDAFSSALLGRGPKFTSLTGIELNEDQWEQVVLALKSTKCHVTGIRLEGENFRFCCSVVFKNAASQPTAYELVLRFLHKHFLHLCLSLNLLNVPPNDMSALQLVASTTSMQFNYRRRCSTTPRLKSSN